MEKKRQEIRAEVDADMHGRSKEARDAEYEKRLKKFYSEEAGRLNNTRTRIKSIVYAEADPGRKAPHNTTITHYPPYDALPLVVQIVVDDHEAVHLNDFNNALKDEVDNLRKAWDEYDRAKGESARTKAKAVIEQAQAAFEKAMPTTECNAYLHTYGLVKQLKSCGYKYYGDLMKDVIDLIKESCKSDKDKARAMAELGTDYGK